MVFTQKKTMHSLEIKSCVVACVLAGIVTASMAQTGTVGFTGMVVSPTCVSGLSGPRVSGTMTTITLPPLSTSHAAHVGDTYGRTAFTLGMGNCAATASVAPMVSITSHQAVGGYIASGIKNLVIELGTETTTDTQKVSTPMPVVQNPGAGLLPLRHYPKNDFYIQYRAVAGDTGSETVAPAPPTITINLIYV
jgi:type 1 fimbria pilin